jgi:hypothetical protein
MPDQTPPMEPPTPASVLRTTAADIDTLVPDAQDDPAHTAGFRDAVMATSAHLRARADVIEESGETSLVAQARAGLELYRARAAALTAARDAVYNGLGSMDSYYGRQAARRTIDAVLRTAADEACPDHRLVSADTGHYNLARCSCDRWVQPDTHPGEDTSAEDFESHLDWIVQLRGMIPIMQRPDVSRLTPSADFPFRISVGRIEPERWRSRLEGL